MKIRLAKKIMKARLLMKKKYSFANAKPVPFGKIDYWFRVGQCGCHKTDYKPNLRDKRKFMAELRRDSNIMLKLF